MLVWCGLFLFVKQKTAYEMRISDWSSDVCSSDLRLFLSINPRLVVLIADYINHDRHERMILAAQFRALTAIGADFFRLEPGVAHKPGNRILLDAECRNHP